jgi:predicted ATPase
MMLGGEEDLRPFLRGGMKTVRLVTTRIDSVLPEGTIRQRVDAMQGSEALRLLAGGLSPDQVSREGRSLAKLAARLGEWAQLLKIVNGFLRDRVANARQSLTEAIVGVNKRLDVKGLVAFDSRNETDRTKAVALTIDVSLELLSEPEQVCFGQLGAFPEDVDIPVGIVELVAGSRTLRRKTC